MGLPSRLRWPAPLALTLLLATVLAGCLGDGEHLMALEEWEAGLQAADDPYLLDVRTQQEFDDGHIEGAHHIPYDELHARAGELPEDKDEPFWLYCRTDRRSQIAAEALEKMGYSDLRVLEGGIIAWEDAGRPTTT